MGRLELPFPAEQAGVHLLTTREVFREPFKVSKTYTSLLGIAQDLRNEVAQGDSVAATAVKDTGLSFPSCVLSTLPSSEDADTQLLLPQPYGWQYPTHVA